MIDPSIARLVGLRYDLERIDSSILGIISSLGKITCTRLKDYKYCILKRRGRPRTDQWAACVGSNEDPIFRTASEWCPLLYLQYSVKGGAEFCVTVIEAFCAPSPAKKKLSLVSACRSDYNEQIERFN